MGNKVTKRAKKVNSNQTDGQTDGSRGGSELPVSPVTSVDIEREQTSEIDGPVINKSDDSSLLATEILDKSLVQSWSNTGLKSYEFCHIWTIERSILCDTQTGESIESSVFTTGADESIKFRLKAYPKGENNEFKDFFGLHLLLVSSNCPEMSVIFKISVINGNEEPTHTQTFEKTYNQNTKSWGYKKLYRKDGLLDTCNGLLIDDKLTLYCEGTLTVKVVNTLCLPIKAPKCCHSWCLGRLFERLSKDFSDVSLEVNGKQFYAHKLALSLISPVFETMFMNDMSETQNNKVIIEDIEEEVLQEMLRFMYTKNVQNLCKLAPKLLSVADKYDIKGLKQLSEQSICQNISVETAAELLILADLHSPHQLKPFIIDFIKKNALKVMVTNGWKSLFETNADLVSQVL